MAKGYYEEIRKGIYKMTVELPPTIKVDGTKKRNRKTKTVEATGPRQMDKKLAEFVLKWGEVNEQHKPDKISFVDFVLKKWLPNYAEGGLGSTTLENYMYYTESRILPAFKDLWLDQITTMHCVEFMKSIQEPGMRLDGKEGSISSSTAEYYYRILKDFFSRAKEWEYIESNPMDNVKKPKRQKKKVQVYNEEQVQEAMQHLWDYKLVWQCLISLDIATGMRREELLGIEDKHFDYEQKKITISQAVIYTKRKGYEVAPLKTDGSDRVVHLSEMLADMIQKLVLYKKKERLATGEYWIKGRNFLFSVDSGKPYHPDSVTNWWRRFTQKHKLSYIRFHALRHTSATLLINQGIHAKIIAERLGHADIKTTMNTYGHVIEKADRTAANLFDVYLNKKKG